MLTPNSVHPEPPLAMFQRCLAWATGIINKKSEHSRKKADWSAAERIEQGAWGGEPQSLTVTPSLISHPPQVLARFFLVHRFSLFQQKKMRLYGSNWWFKLKLYFSAARQRGELSGSLTNSGNGTQGPCFLYRKQNEGEKLQIIKSVCTHRVLV
jgi:hypothetical protein